MPTAWNTLKLNAKVGLFHLYHLSEDDNLTFDDQPQLYAGLGRRYTGLQGQGHL